MIVEKAYEVRTIIIHFHMRTLTQATLNALGEVPELKWSGGRVPRQPVWEPVLLILNFARSCISFPSSFDRGPFLLWVVCSLGLRPSLSRVYPRHNSGPELVYFYAPVLVCPMLVCVSWPIVSPRLSGKAAYFFLCVCPWWGENHRKFCFAFLPPGTPRSCCHLVSLTWACGRDALFIR